MPGSDLLGDDTLSFQGSALFGEWHLDDVSVTSAVPEPPLDLAFAGAALIAISLRLRVRARRSGTRPRDTAWPRIAARLVAAIEWKPRRHAAP